jgi:hypothetical protein
LIDMDHPLVRLGQYIDWDCFAATLGGSYHPTHKRGQKKAPKSPAKTHKTHDRKYSIRPCQKVSLVRQQVRIIQRQFRPDSNAFGKVKQTKATDSSDVR